MKLKYIWCWYKSTNVSLILSNQRDQEIFLAIFSFRNIQWILKRWWLMGWTLIQQFSLFGYKIIFGCLMSYVLQFVPISMKYLGNKLSFIIIYSSHKLKWNTFLFGHTLINEYCYNAFVTIELEMKSPNNEDMLEKWELIHVLFLSFFSPIHS